jgi:hypothetical protein
MTDELEGHRYQQHSSQIVKSSWDAADGHWWCEVVCTCGQVFIFLDFRQHAEETYI